jgi:small subunit ribosomal protein S16
VLKTKIMLAISLMRIGAKGKPFYRVVVKEKRSKRDGKYIENLGTYNPMTDPADVSLKHDRILYWIGVGAQPTDTVKSLIKHNPEQTEEEKAAAASARAERAAAARQAQEEAKKAEAAKKEEERLAAERAAAEAAAAEAAETASAEEAEVSGTEGVEAAPAEDAAPVEEASAAVGDEAEPVKTEE